MNYKELKLNPNNPREISKDDFDKLKKSLLEFPEMLELRPIVYKDGIIIGGNMRYRALLEIGIEVKESYFKDAYSLTPAQVKEFIVKDNVPFGEWDYDLLANEWSDLPLVDWGIDPNLLGIEENADPDDVPALTEDAKSQVGEIYQLGRHRLLCGSCNDISRIMDVKADMVFTDPPYNVNYKGSAGKIKNDNLGDEFYKFLYDAIKSMKPHVKGALYICMSSSELHTLFKAFTDNGGHWSTFIIWVKNTFTLGRSNYHRQYEPILYGWFDDHYWSKNRKLSDVYKDNVIEDALGNKMLLADLVDTDVWEFDKPNKNKEHPTMKPVGLVARAVVNSSPEKGIVLDPFAGSGTTMIACEQNNRSCYMSELDPRFCDVIRKRYYSFIGRPGDWDKI